MKTILEHLQSIKYPKLQKFCIDNLDVRYSNTLTYCLSYALMLGVDLSANNTKNKKWISSIYQAAIKNKI